MLIGNLVIGNLSGYKKYRLYGLAQIFTMTRHERIGLTIELQPTPSITDNMPFQIQPTENSNRLE